MKENLDLMKPAYRIVKLVHQRRSAYCNLQTGFLINFAHQIVVQRGASFHPAPRRAPQIRPPVRKGVHQQKRIVLQNQSTGGKARGFRFHAPRLSLGA